MAAGPAGAEASPANDGTPIAGFWRRLAAFLIDSLILGVPAMLLGLAMFRWAASLGQGGRIIGFVVALLYFGLLNSRLGGGQTLGKRLLGIRVVDRAGAALSSMRSGARYLVLAAPYVLNGLWFDVNAGSVGTAEYLLGILLIFIVFGGTGSIVYLFVFNRRTRQSLHDLAVGSFVVRGRPAAVPAGLTTPRLHLIMVGCWLALALIGPGMGLSLLRDSSLMASFEPLRELQTAIRTRHDVRQVTVVVGSTTAITAGTGSSTTTSLLVRAVAANGNDDLDALLDAVAGTVLGRHPDLLGKDVLIVRISRGFDLGIASWTVSHQEALDAMSWRRRLARPPRPPA